MSTNLAKNTSTLSVLSKNSSTVSLLSKSSDSISALGKTPVIIDSYSESNADGPEFLSSVDSLKVAQSFKPTGDFLITSCKFYISKVGSPTGNAVATLYTHSGTYGVNGSPTGSALATSSTFDVSTLSGSYALISFSFPASVQYTISNGTPYFIAVEYSGGGIGNYIQVQEDSTDPSHGGNYAYYVSSWNPYSGTNVCFYLYGINAGNLSKSTSTPSVVSKS